MAMIDLSQLITAEMKVVALQPFAVSAAQARLALLDAGLLATVKAAVDQADEATQIWFEYATEWRRDHPILAALGAQVGLSSGEIDGLFRAAVLL